MKKVFILSMLFVGLITGMNSCIPGDDEPTVSSGIEDDGSGRIPAKTEIIGNWQSAEYQGWEPRLQQDVVIARGLTINSDGTYENKYRGHLTQAKDGSTLSTTDFGEWEIEKGRWSYTESTGEITYYPSSDSRIVYDTQKMESQELDTYKEKCLIKESGTYKGGWITLDTYLKRAGNKGDLRYVINKK